MTKNCEWYALILCVPMIKLSEYPLQIYANTTPPSTFQVGKTNIVTIFHRRTKKEQMMEEYIESILSIYNLYPFGVHRSH